MWAASLEDGVSGGEAWVREGGNVLFKVGSALAYAVEKLAAGAKLRDDVEVVESLKVVDEGDGVRVTLGDLLHGHDFVADHGFAALEQLLADDFASVALAIGNALGLLDDSIGAATEGAASLVGAGHGARTLAARERDGRRRSGGHAGVERWWW